MSSESETKGGKPSRALILVAVFAAAAGIWLGVDFFGDGRGPAPPTGEMQASTLLPTPKPLTPFTLADQDGRPFTLDDLAGRWTFVSFGYTSCPDVCPTTMATFNALDGMISPEGT